MTEFELTTETKITLSGVILFRVILTKDCEHGKAGSIGGWVENKENISENAWVSGDSKVYGNSKVFGNAIIYGDACVFGNACVSGNAMIFGNAEISGNSKVYGSACVYGNVIISGNSKVFGNACVSGDSKISGNSKVYGNAIISGNAEIFGDAELSNEGFTLNFVYLLTLTDNHIKYGCVQKTIIDWVEWLESDKIINTPRDSSKFKLIKMSLSLAIEKWKQLNNDKIINNVNSIIK